MLYSPGDTSKPVAHPGGLGVGPGDAEAGRPIWKRQGLPRYSEEDVDEMTSLGRPKTDEEGDELYERSGGCRRTSTARVSASLLQRRLGVGYPRAARLIDLMEERGVITSSEDGRSREVVQRAEAAEAAE